MFELIPGHKQICANLAPGLGSNLRLNPCFLHKSRFLIGDKFKVLEVRGSHTGL